MDIFDFKPLECPLCKAPMKCVHININGYGFSDEDRYTVMYRCTKRHIFQGTFDKDECMKLKGAESDE